MGKFKAFLKACGLSLVLGATMEAGKDLYRKYSDNPQERAKLKNGLKTLNPFKRF